MQFPEVFIFIMQKIAYANRKLDPKGPWQHMQNYRKAKIKIFSQPMENTIKKKPNFSLTFVANLTLSTTHGRHLKNILLKNAKLKSTI